MKYELKDLSKNPIQVYCDSHTQLIDVLDSILEQIGGNAHLLVTTFSTSEEFLRRLFLLKQKGMISYSIMLADIKASFKTVNLNELVKSCFDEIYLNQNHSKLLLVANEKFSVSVCTSQNQTRGNRLESGIITTDLAVYNQLYTEVTIKISNSINL